MGDPEYSGKWQDMGGGWQVMFNSTDHIGIFYLRRLNKKERRERKAHEARTGKGTWGKGCGALGGPIEGLQRPWPEPSRSSQSE